MERLAPGDAPGNVDRSPSSDGSPSGEGERPLEEPSRDAVDIERPSPDVERE